MRAISKRDKLTGVLDGLDAGALEQVSIEVMSTLSKQCRRKAEQEGYVSLMNDTKWRELCIAFSDLEKRPMWRTRDFLNGYLSDWDSDWYHHVGPDYCSIEWLEIDPKDCARECIRSVLREVGAPVDESEQYFRVVGYRR